MMNRFPAPDMAGALRLTRQGRLKEAVEMLRGRSASPPPRPRPEPTAPPAAGSAFRRADQALQSALGSVMPFDAGQFLREALTQIEPRPLNAPSPRPAGGSFEARSFSSEAGSRNYKLFVPSGYRGQKLPLIVMLHGCTQSPDDFAAGTQMNVLAEEQGFLVAYPEQARSANLSRCWNWFHAAHQKRGQGEPALIAGITREIMAEFNIAPGRVYIAGLSAGGAAAAIMGAAYPELYAAIGVHSGLASGAASDLPSALAAMKHGLSAPAASSRLIPAIVFHGDKDATVNIANAGHVIAQAKGDAALRREVTESDANGMRYTRIVHLAGSRPALEEWVLHGAGHAWSGGNPAGTYTDAHGPDASREMIRFFLQQPA